MNLRKGGDTRNPSYRQQIHGSRISWFREAYAIPKRSARLAETDKKTILLEKIYHFLKKSEFENFQKVQKFSEEFVQKTFVSAN